MALSYSSDAFAPIRGTEQKILQTPVQNGQVYFSTDTNNVFFDAGEKRHQVNGAGITFVYGNATGEGDIVFDTDSEYYRFPREKVLQEKNVTDCYLVGDIIINADGTFYKIAEITEEHCLCTKMLVAGSGGGGGTGVNRWLLAVEHPDNGYQGLPFTWPYGEKIEGYFKVAQESMGQTANIFVKVKDEYAAEEWREAASQNFSVNVGENFLVTLSKEHLVAGKNNYVVVQAEVNGELSNLLTYTINCVDMKYEADSTWDVSSYKSMKDGVVFPYVVTSASADLSQEKLDITVVYTVDDQYTMPAEKVETVSGTHILTPLFESLPQGGHVLKVRATTNIAGREVVIGDLVYGIGWYTGEKSAFIWSDYNNTEEINYDIIRINYWAFDPARTATGDAVIKFFINDEEVSEETVPANTKRTWNIENYIPEKINVFKMQCVDYILEFEVYIKRNSSVDLEAYAAGCELYLTPKGRSNNEPLARRQVWKNSAPETSTTLNVGEPKLEGFNWYNNGWFNETDGSVLRVSNGAKVSIPMNALFSADNRTFEFDFKVKYPTDYSKLITIVDTGRFEQETDKDGNIVQGNPILESRLDPDPKAFLKYFNAEKARGIVLNTQEAAFALGSTTLTSVRYADNNRIKISIVVDATGAQGQVYDEKGNAKMDGDTPVVKRLVYLYVNGVLSGLLTINDTSTLDITTAESAIEINSDYCDVDIYGIRVYNTGLSYSQIAQNWIGDASSLNDKLIRYYINRNILTQGKIDYKKVMNLKKTLLDLGFSEEEAAANSIPVMIIKTYLDNSQGVTGTDNMLPYSKGNKKCVAVRYYDPNNPDACFHGQNLELDVQGTSSQGYPRRNYKLKTKEFNKGYLLHPFHFQKWDGLESNKDIYNDEELEDGINIGYGDGSLLEKEFCLKADYMESSSTHNTGFANLIGKLSINVEGTAYDFRHPLVKDFGLDNAAGYRTTVFGFPIVIFHENQAGNIEYVGKYNFNIDKGATDSFGFTDGEINEFSAVEKHVEWVKKDPGEGNYIMPNKDKNKWLVETEAAQGTFEQLSECWEFTQNQAGLGKFTGAQNAPLATNDKGQLSIFDHFEARYHVADFEDGGDVYSIYPNAADANAKLTPFLSNFVTMWNWVNSTDTNEDAVTNEVFEADKVKYYRTLSKTWDPERTYYEEPGVPKTIVEKPSAAYDKSENEVTEIKNIDAAKFYQKIAGIKVEGGAIDLAQCLGVYTFSYNEDDGEWYFYDYTVDENNPVAYKVGDGSTDDSHDFGFTVPEDGLWIHDTEAAVVDYQKTSFSIELTSYADGFKTSLYEKHEKDDASYRLAKFKNEFEEHFDLSYCLIYFILTELLLCYDSRQKNMMIATYGPKKLGGHHIWYPIFYDIDTQLGVNNSGQIYWDYDADATPLEIDEATGRLKDSIFSGNGSVLWYNFVLCFQDQIKDAYRAMRKGELKQETLEIFYNENGSDKWSNTFKNIDADYKYLAPATTGYVDQSGKWAQTAKYYYCLQGDRKLSRSAFFRNRLNYIDSQWQGGDYDPTSTKGQIKMRYNANDRANTSDDGSNPDLNTNLDFTLTPFLSQYVSVIFDETATEPVKYDLTKAEAERTVVIEPIESIGKQLDAGYTLSQQLIYIRGPQFISDFGDLSLKYLNEFDCTPATSLRRLHLGNETAGYRNDSLASKDFELDSSAGSQNAKVLLQELNLSQLSKLSEPLDVGGCSKLETVKLMGTCIPYTVLPKGNMLKHVYFPDTTTQFNLINPLVLNKVITDRSTLSSNPEGLYIDNLTNVMNSSIDATHYTIIEALEIEKDRFGLDSYRMLKYLYNVKKAKIDGTYAETYPNEALNTKTKVNLGIKLTEVNWSPYVAVASDAAYDTSTYYVKVNGIAYEEFSGDVTEWTNQRNDGNLYTYDASLETNYPITDLAMLKHFKDQHAAGNDVVPYDKFYFKSTVKSSIAGQKLLPVITGRMHVKNVAQINETELFELVEYFNAQNKNFGDFEITVDDYKSTYSVEFIEYGQDGVRKTLGWQKTSDGTDSVVYPHEDDPTRLHYDFIGWTYDDGDVYRKKGSIVGEDFEGELFQTTDLINLKFKDAVGDDTNGRRYTLVALYRLRGYNIYYQVGDTLFDTVVVPAGSKISAPEKVPYLDDTVGYDLYETNHFLGWSSSPGGQVIDVTAITAQGENTFHAIFETVNVYEYPLDSKYLQPAELDTAKMTCSVGLKKEYGLRGKICIPKTYVDESGEYTIIGIAGASLTADGNGFSNADESVSDHIFAVFFKGVEDNTAVITKLADSAFIQCQGLVHVDFPASLTNIGANCFSNAINLQFYDLINVRTFGRGAFATAGINVTQATTLVISPDAFYDRSFQGCGHKNVDIGSRANPMTSTSSLWTTSYANAFLGTADTVLNTWFLEKVTVYHDSTLSSGDANAKVQTLIYHFSEAVDAYGLSIDPQEV